MYLDKVNFQKIADHFGNKFSNIQYAGCWDSKTVTFAVWQDGNEKAGFTLTIWNPEGPVLEKVNVKRVERASVYHYNEKAQRYMREQLPLFIPS